MERITPEEIKGIKTSECVLIGTNEAGIHGAGIAEYAYKHWGAVLGQGFGPMSNCFGLPTKDWEVHTLPLDRIAFYVSRYIDWVKIIRNGRWTHYVTKIGCGLAGYTPKDIAMMFSPLRYTRNVYLPKEFIEIIDINHASGKALDKGLLRGVGE